MKSHINVQISNNWKGVFCKHAKTYEQQRENKNEQKKKTQNRTTTNQKKKKRLNNVSVFKEHRDFLKKKEKNGKMNALVMLDFAYI